MQTMRAVVTKVQPKPVLWIDLDGTVRYGFDELGYWPKSEKDVFLFPGVVDILREYKNAGWRIVSVSNQGGVALGYLTLATCMKMMARTHQLCDGLFDKMATCTHHPDAERLEDAMCWCRKPRIGLLVDCGIALAEQHNEYYPPHMGGFVGDRKEDEECAANANLRFMHAKQWRDEGWKLWLNKE